MQSLIISKAENDAKKKVEDGSLTTFDTPELICTVLLILICSDDVFATKATHFTPEPRKVGCSFWYYFESKLCRAEKEEGSTV